MSIPQMAELRQVFTRSSIVCLKEAVWFTLETSELKEQLKPGDRVAITAGSRGIRDIVEILKITVDYLYSLNCKPFILSAMGSHGDGTVPGQLKILKELGITLDSIGAPILASQQSTTVFNDYGENIFVNALATSFDGIIVVNRIKPHTSFRGKVESGLQKMIAVGLGGIKGASKIHKQKVDFLSQAISNTASALVKQLPIKLALALIEDGSGNILKLEAMSPAAISRREPVLLEEARINMPSLPFKALDILIVDEIGKNFSGTGMDTNIIGRTGIDEMTKPRRPRIEKIIVLNISAKSYGNAYGIGLADYTTSRLAEGINYDMMRINAKTSGFVNRIKMPVTLPNDFLAIQAAIKSLNKKNPGNLKIARINNTLHIDRIMFSETLINEAINNPRVSILSQFNDLKFDRQNNLFPF